MCLCRPDHSVFAGGESAQGGGAVLKKSSFRLWPIFAVGPGSGLSALLWSSHEVGVGRLSWCTGLALLVAL